MRAAQPQGPPRARQVRPDRRAPGACSPRCGSTPRGCRPHGWTGTARLWEILLGARDELATARTGQVNRLRALLLGGDDADRQAARGALTDSALAVLARRRCPPGADRAQGVRHAEIRRLVVAVRDGGRELTINNTQLKAIAEDMAPGLTDRRGVGPVTAAQVIVSFSHPGRCRHDAAFAAPAGTCPLPASSGRTVRHRLNRGGDRALNSAVHTIANTRMRCCERTRAYVERRTAQGKTKREIRRCLTRYITRELHRALTTAMTPTATP